jgi:DNA-binding SARP family transcriptional activator
LHNLSEEASKKKEDISSPDNQEKLIAFEPLHTFDYFASQGIKISEEHIANDKLGNQMKSFTEWLKSMKKVHKENLAADDPTDKKIQQIAEDSNADTEVVTEAMAEVLVKQNKIDKAIEVYEKLSLLNPSKSSYFAAQINQLNPH